MAAKQGLQQLYGDVLATNQGMLRLARGLGFDLRRHPDGGAMVWRVQRGLNDVSAAAQPPCRDVMAAY
jgi:hypothetical protein